jgi:LysR family transcriptional activator of nhaA
MEWLNYHHLLYFWTVAKEGSVSRAAAILHISQPTVSAQLKSLERSLGQRLFERRGRSIGLTTEGEAVFRYADEIFSLGRELLQTVKGEPAAVARRFRVGISDALPKLTTYRLLEPALAMQPSFRLHVRIDKTEKLLVELGEHGLGLFAAPTVVSQEICRRRHVTCVGELDRVREKFYAISVERRISHPAVRLIADQAKRRLFA